MRRAKIFQDPWARAAQERDLAERSDLVFVDVFLIFLGPALRGGAVQTVLGFAAKLADDHRLVVGRAPNGYVQVRRDSFVPTDVLVDSKNIQVGDDGIVKDPLVRLSRVGLICSRRDQARRIQRARHDDELMKEGVSLC